MKRIFTLTILMTAFVMNAVAQWNQDAKIEEVHWFGMHEFYNSPIYGINRNRTDVTGIYLTNADFSQGLNGWNTYTSNEYHDQGYGNIGSYAVWNNTNTSSTDDNHPNSMMCLGMECRWSGNYSSFYQEMSSLPAGSYKLTYDVQNGNSQTLRASYESLFYVEVNGTRYTDLRTEWMNRETGWNTHTIEFVITGAAANAKISFGYGTGTNGIRAEETPALYVSNLKLERAAIDPESDDNTMITWSGNYLESLTVVKDWTGQEDIQRPKTSFYSWLYHQLRFSVDNTSLWWFGSVTTGSVNNSSQTDLSNYYGLKNFSGNGENFTIHNLEAGDQINIEYNTNSNNSNTAYLVSGSLSSMSANDPINSKENNELKYYTVSADGDVCINIPGGAVIRAVRIILKEYQVADMDVTELNTAELHTYLDTYGTYDSESSFGYRYTFKNPGVLEDKRGAVPYITMKFGNDNDMTFVRKLTMTGQESESITYGATSIVNQTNVWDPDEHQYHIKNVLQRNFDTPTQPIIEGQRSAAELQDMFVGKEWSVFTADHDNDADYGAGVTHNGQLVVWRDIFNTIYPLSGNYFYFFPEVDGTLAIDFYCEGAEENTAFWWKEDANGNPMDGSVQDQVRCNQYNSAGVRIGGSIGRTDGTNHYYLTAEVKKGCVYYFCSLPTNNAHEHPIIRLKSYAFMPNFRVTPLYKVVTNAEVVEAKTQGGTALTHVAEIIGGPYDDLNGQASGSHNYEYELTGNYTRNAEEEPRVKCLGNVVSAKAKVEYDGTKQWLSFYDIVFRTGYNAAGEAYNPGGAVVAHVNGSEGAASFVLTIAYDAADAKWNDDKTQRVAADIENKVEVKHWDFYSGKGNYITKRNGVVSYNGGDTGYTTEINSGWELGKYKDRSDLGTPEYDPNGGADQNWFKKSKLYKETHKADGQTADWEYDWVDVQNKKEPLYKSIYDMDGDNADMIHETAGLVFFTDPNELGIWNENDAPTSSFQDRFIGLMGGGKLIIPRLEANDRVVIKMGCFGNAESASRGTADFEQEAVLWLTNAKDAKGTAIPAETNYVIGGSTPYPNETVPRGEYHFIVANTSTSDATDFAIEVKDAALLKIYSIVIYRNAANNNADILTENFISGNREVLYTDKDDNSITKGFDLSVHYSGYQEQFAYQSMSKKTGSFKNNNSLTLTPSGGKTFTLTATKGEFGSFRPRIAVETQDNSYVTDYADYSVAQGYRETKQYPYTWDFTDLRQYAKSGSLVDNNGTEANAETGLEVWKESSLNVTPEDNGGLLFVSGSQLYAGTQKFDESAGIGIEHFSNTATRNGKLSMTNDTNGGLAINDTEAWGFVVPSVGPNGAVYVHAKTTSNSATPQYALSVYNLDLTATALGGIPAGWSCTQENDGNGNSVVHSSGESYTSGSRIFSGFEGYQGKALYWRVNNATSGPLPLTPGTYELSFAMAAWKGEPNYKVEIFKNGESSALATSESYLAAPNANGNTTDDLSEAVRRVLTFTVSEAANYIINFSSTDEGFTEFLLLDCKIKTPTQNFTYSHADENGNGGYVYAMSLPSTASETGTDVELFFQGYEINKIAVSDYSKKVNKKGWTTESRNRDIDASLTAYMTGKDIETYIVSHVDYPSKSVTFSDVTNKRMPSAAENGSKNACILRNTAGSNVSILDGGFHLFVPDMHDVDKETPTLSDGQISGNELRAQLNSGTVAASNGDYTNYAFTFRYYDIDPKTGKILSGATLKEGDQAFYRITYGGASSDGNQAYLPLLTSQVIGTSGGSARFSIVFDGDDTENNQSTAIEELYIPIEADMEIDENTQYYNLNGQQLNGRPTHRGLYLVNGKKMYIK